MTKDLECYNGWTDVGIFIYFDDEVVIDECQECKPPAADAEDVVAYYFEVRKKIFANFGTRIDSASLYYSCTKKLT